MADNLLLSNWNVILIYQFKEAVCGNLSNKYLLFTALYQKQTQICTHPGSRPADLLFKTEVIAFECITYKKCDIGRKKENSTAQKGNFFPHGDALPI